MLMSFHELLCPQNGLIVTICSDWKQ